MHSGSLSPRLVRFEMSACGQFGTLRHSLMHAAPSAFQRFCKVHEPDTTQCCVWSARLRPLPSDVTTEQERRPDAGLSRYPGLRVVVTGLRSSGRTL